MSSDAAIQASGIGATQPGWLAQWQAWRSSWNLWYTAKLPTCSFLFPYLPGNTNEADLHTELDSQVVQFRAFQQQAVAYGIQIPGGILPDPNASPSSVSWVTWAIVGLVGVAFVAVMVHGASSAAGRIVPVVA